MVESMLSFSGPLLRSWQGFRTSATLPQSAQGWASEELARCLVLKFASVGKDGDSGSILSLDSEGSVTPQDGWGKEEKKNLPLHMTSPYLGGA